MAHIIQAVQRLTHRYVDSCSHLDKWDDENPVTLKVLSGQYLSAYEADRRDGGNGQNIDPSDNGMSNFRVVLMNPRSLTDKAVERVIHDQFTSQGCSHEHDCCGCHGTSITTLKKMGKREWYVGLHHTRNY